MCLFRKSKQPPFTLVLAHLSPPRSALSTGTSHFCQILASYGVFISQLIRYARACSFYECFNLRAVLLSNKLLGEGYVKERLKSSIRKFYGRYGDLTKQYEVPPPECYGVGTGILPNNMRSPSRMFWMMTIYSDTLH